jgi:NAD(P)-dependent dehydrogenase (short-subunit alcohol dehydrogenase family)
MANILVTGANRGIGLGLTKHFRARGDEVIGVCRHASPALAETGAQVEAGIDVTDANALSALAQRLKGQRIDQLWLNAGILERDTLDSLDGEGFEALRRQFEVNAIGPLQVAHALQGSLGKGSKIAILTSRMGSIADNGSGAYYGYRASKAAVNAIGKSLAIDLAPRGVAVYLLHPGYVATDMVDGHGDITPEVAAERLAGIVAGLGQEQTGSFWHSNGSALPW